MARGWDRPNLAVSLAAQAIAMGQTPRRTDPATGGFCGYSDVGDDGRHLCWIKPDHEEEHRCMCGKRWPSDDILRDLVQ